MADVAAPAAATAAIPFPHESVNYGLAVSSNPQRTAPKIEFVADVGAFLASINKTADEVLAEFNRLHAGFKAHQSKLVGEKEELERRLPELEENVALIETLQKKFLDAKKQEFDVRFMAADGVWVDALLDKPGTVSLWLGANVMMQYTYEDAAKLLGTSVKAAKEGIAAKTEELEFVKDQLTTCEVSISRFYNFEVARKKAQAGKQPIANSGD